MTLVPPPKLRPFTPSPRPLVTHLYVVRVGHLVSVVPEEQALQVVDQLLDLRVAAEGLLRQHELALADAVLGLDLQQAQRNAGAHQK